jgi:starch-binding outer membrane protein, SusD/RagB family
MNMKRISIYILLLLPLASCNESNLDITPGSPVESNFYKEEIDLDGLVRGIYAKQTELYNYRANGYVHAVRHLPGDDVTTVQTSPFETFATLQPNTGQLFQMYISLYRIVSRANTAIVKVNEAAEAGVYKTQGLKDYHLGEAYFMRGFAYFHLSNYFGTSPLNTERITLDNAYGNSVAEGELLNQAIKDFTEAAKLLPESWDIRSTGRATKNAAYGFLGKSLVFRGSIAKTAADYTAAIQAFDAIKGRSLMPDFSDNFDAKKENNVESLWEFQASQPPNNDNFFLAAGDDFEQGGVGSTSAWWGIYQPGNAVLFGTPNYLATKKLAAAFDPADPRLERTLNPANRNIRKYWLSDQVTSRAGGSANNPRILRYADVLLLKAEALVQSGGLIAEAVLLINQIRTRARLLKAGGTVPADYNSAAATPAQVMEWIRTERLLELAGEESHRWFDLRRWHKGGQIDLSKWDFSTDQVANFGFDANKHLLFPIPIQETDNNQNVKQNTGY